MGLLGNDYVFDRVIGVLRDDFLVDQIILAVVRAAIEDRLGARFTDLGSNARSFADAVLISIDSFMAAAALGAGAAAGFGIVSCLWAKAVPDMAINSAAAKVMTFFMWSPVDREVK